MSNKIKLSKHKNENTYWITINHDSEHTIPVNKQFESENIEEVIHALISEFSQSDNDQKNRYALLLRKWLGNMNDIDLEINEAEKTRDLIYEMF